MSESSASQPLAPITADLGNEATKRIQKDILDFLFTKRSATGGQIGREVPGRRRTKIAALKYLVREGAVLRTGSGKKCDPFRYRLSRTESTARYSSEPEIYEEVI
ncbi:MAG: hypothetical protein KF681_04710 [Bdellovibrionaceae bacterium]|nr:hypothetical protein [Pseudobdellovibrionaceae bacterium]